jgi:hypothetical protein
MSDIVYVVPSYNRIETLKTKTLALLERYEIPKEHIFIFTAPDEFQSYQIAFSQYSVIEGKLGLKNQRNFITEYFPENKKLVCLDDDIEDLKQLKDGKLVPIEDLKLLVDGAFLACELHKLSMWGIYPITNAFFMKEGYSTDLKFCIGCVWGIINRKDIVLTMDYKEDYERTLKCYKRDDGVVRLNFVCAKTKMYQAGGMGLNQKERLEHNMKSAKSLIDLFPGLVRHNKKREGEILLSQPKADGTTTPRVDRTTTKTTKRVARSAKGMESSKTK